MSRAGRRRIESLPASFPLLLRRVFAVDPQRGEYTLERHVGLLADGSHVRFRAIEEAEDGLIRGHKNRSAEINPPARVAELGRCHLRSPHGGHKRVFVHTRPIALDQVAPRMFGAGHLVEATVMGPKRNRVFPYVYAGVLSAAPSCAPSSARERMPSLR